MNEKSFTLVFEGDIRALEGNPLKTDTPFGRPVASGIGNAFDQLDALTERAIDLEAEVLRLREALEAITGVGFDAPMTWGGTDAEWERKRANIMQATARAALKGESP